MVWSGDSEVIGSWKMIEMRPPRIARILRLSRGSLTMSTTWPSALGSWNRISPLVIVAFCGRMPMIAWETTVLPEPDSPTSATVPPSGILKDVPRTASTMPPCTWKLTCRSLISRRSRMNPALFW